VTASTNYTDWGIYLDSSSNNKVCDNNLTRNGGGINLDYSSENTVSNDNVTENGGGISISLSSNNTLSNNTVTGSGSWGMWLMGSSNSMVSDNTVTRNHYDGIILDSFSGDTVSGNNVSGNFGNGIYLDCSNEMVSGNNVTGNSDGITLDFSSSGNSIVGNNIKNNSEYGVWLYSSSSGNRFYHNNFIGNTKQVYLYTSSHANVWDDGYPSGGNYWSDYRTKYPNAAENDSSGLWNTPYVIDANNTDGYPLMAPFCTFDVSTRNGTAYAVGIVSNSSITNLSFNQPAKTLSFKVTGTNGTMGFCRVAIPNMLMSCANLEDWMVTVNGTLINDRTIINDTSYTYIYFTYHHSTETVQIQSTSAIPESQPSMLLPLFMIITLLGAMVIKRKRKVAHVSLQVRTALAFCDRSLIMYRRVFPNFFLGERPGLPTVSSDVIARETILHLLNLRVRDYAVIMRRLMSGKLYRNPSSLPPSRNS
jgi:parallel beta-helix repeat protein